MFVCVCVLHTPNHNWFLTARDSLLLPPKFQNHFCSYFWHLPCTQSANTLKDLSLCRHPCLWRINGRPHEENWVFFLYAGQVLVKFESFTAGTLHYSSIRKYFTQKVSQYSTIGLVTFYFRTKLRILGMILS